MKYNITVIAKTSNNMLFFLLTPVDNETVIKPVNLKILYIFLTFGPGLYNMIYQSITWWYCWYDMHLTLHTSAYLYQDSVHKT